MFSKQSDVDAPAQPQRAFQVSKTVLGICAALAITAGLAIIVVACFGLERSSPYPIIQCIVISIAVLWVSIPLASSDQDLLAKIANNAFLFFAVLYFIAAQTIIAFWITLLLLTSIIVAEHGRRIDTDPAYTRLAQIITVLLLTATGLRHFTELFLPTLQEALRDQYAWFLQVLRLREAVAVCLLFIVIYATGINTIQRLRMLEWREYRSPTSSNAIVLALFDVRYYVLNGGRFFALAFVIILREAIVYVINTIFNPNLLRTILYSAATAALAAALVAEAYFAHPFLLTILRSTDPFFAPSEKLLYAYGVIGGVLAVVITELALLIWIWLPRKGTRMARRPTWQSFTLVTVGVGVCVWFASTTAWLTNSLVHLDPKPYVTPGYFTAIVVPFAFWAAIQAFRSGLLWDTPESKIKVQ
jgi:hypothetical protein